MPNILATFQCKEDGKTLYVSVPSSNHAGEYLIGVSLRQNNIIIAHICPSFKFRNSCRHMKTALDAFKEHFWWKELSKLPIVCKQKSVFPSRGWELIPIPGSAPDFGEVEEERKHVHSA